MFVVRRRRKSSSAILLLAGGLLITVSGPAQARPAETQPMDDARLVGFTSVGVPVTEVQAGWMVPYLDCDSTPDAEASILISMGKAGHENLVSIGMTAACVDHAAVYSGWYKLPDGPRSDCPGGPPVAGQHVLARMDAIGTIGLGMTACASIMTQLTVHGLTSASFVVRATGLGGQAIKPLADFGTVYVTNAKVNKKSIAHGDAINWRMVAGDGTVRAVTAGLHPSGSFAVNWRAAR